MFDFAVFENENCQDALWELSNIRLHISGIKKFRLLRETCSTVTCQPQSGKK